MRVKAVNIEGFKKFDKFYIDLKSEINVIVGDNETGKSTILDAINLVLTGKYNGLLIQNALDPYMFNYNQVKNFFKNIQDQNNYPVPKILIEAYLESINENPEVERLRGNNNQRNEDCPGLKMNIEVDSDCLELLKEYAQDETNPFVLPTELFKISWKAFSNETINSRKIPFKTTKIDHSSRRLQGKPYKYLSQMVDDILTDSQRRNLSIEYKRLQHEFSKQPGVKAINDVLEKQELISSKKLTIDVDMSSHASWESAVTAHLSDLPFTCAGQGEQCRIQLRIAIAGAEESNVLLLEELENHLSHSKLNMLMDDLKKACSNQQVIISTHSGFVLNKLGLDNLKLISFDSHTFSLDNLSKNTKNYFLKLPGYDTLRLVLSKKCILVEGPSDELIVQRAYKNKYDKLPLEDGVDVICVGSLAFKRFLEIAAQLNLNVCVLTDNDGNVAELEKKYSEFISKKYPNIYISYSKNESCESLESQLIAHNSYELLNKIFQKNYSQEKLLVTLHGVATSPSFA